MYINRSSSNGLIFPVKSKNNQRFIYTFMKIYFYTFIFSKDIEFYHVSLLY